MTGILETMNERLTALEAKVASLGGGQNAGATLGAGAQQVASAVTPEMLGALVQEIVGNEQAKAAMIRVMGEIGVTELPKATAQQIPVLYAKFNEIKAVLAQQAAAAPDPFAGLGGGAASTGGAPNII